MTFREFTVDVRSVPPAPWEAVGPRPAPRGRWVVVTCWSGLGGRLCVFGALFGGGDGPIPSRQVEEQLCR